MSQGVDESMRQQWQWEREQRWTLCVQGYVQGRRSLRSFKLKLGERELKLISYRSDGALEVYRTDENGLELFQGYLRDVMAATRG